MSEGVGFDKNNLDFEEKKSKFSDYLKNGLKWFFGCSFLAICYYVVFSLIYSNEQESKLIKESDAIAANLDRMEQQMDVLEGVIDNLQAKDYEIYQNIFNSEPPYFELSSVDYSEFLNESDTLDLASVARHTAQKISHLEVRMSSFDRVLRYVSKVATDSLAFVRGIPSIIPIEDFSLPKTGATIGKKMHPFYKTITQHTGLDLVTSVGTKVISAADGVVSSVTKSPKGKGNNITITHPSGYVTTYSHLSQMVVKKGQKVKQGDHIGRVGISGTVFAPHLHYEVIYNGEYMNPIDYFFVDLNPLEYREMMMIAVNTGQSLD
jgi:murein DD-endopeptidase MepM/ murein hydrolase activator NlpD